jgi:hypothetical protein
VTKRCAAAVVISVALAVVHAYAQNIIVGGSRGGMAKWARAEDFDGSFHYCRGFYTSVYQEPGGMGWWTDYPAADNNFSVRLAELTKFTSSWMKAGSPTSSSFHSTTRCCSAVRFCSWRM